jgi:ribonuclease VapC
MFVDASAICAVLLSEPDAETYATKITQAEVRVTSTVAVFEAVLAYARSLDGDVGRARRDLAKFLKATNMQVMQIGDAELERALDAFDRFGKGRHPAKLNMGDCFAYACARTHGVPLLFKGDDFLKTDIAVA